MGFFSILTAGGIFGIIIALFIDSGGFGSGVAIKGSKKYDQYNRDADAKVKEILKNGSGSSKEELKEWWDKYHPPKTK